MAQRPTPISVLLRSEETNGVLSLMDNRVAAGFPGPPLHHHDFDETFHVLEGELTFQVVDELVTARAGELVFAPRGVPHTFANLSARPARVMLVCTPAGFERYFARMAAEHEGVEPPEWALQPTPPVTVVGPRIGERAGG
jgi:mannose-6-phosphate isomerase-like protein (cupin superfamily)